METDKKGFASDSFLAALKTIPEEEKQNLYFLKNKLFVSEDYVSTLIGQYRKWLSNSGIDSYSDEKLLFRIFG